jgi:ssRNA-specific RNase YbeY (16S rRNA maturation enzyme)
MLHSSCFVDNQRWRPINRGNSIAGPFCRRTITSSSLGRSIGKTINEQHRSSTRLFGSNPSTPNAKPGLILLSDDRDPTPSATPIDLSALHKTIEITREIIGYPTYDVSLSLVDDPYMQELNMGTRGVNAPTDVLSFCFQDKFVKPGVLGEVQFDFDDFYNLGDMLIDVDYVKRKCEEDRATHDAAGQDGGGTKLGPRRDGDGMMEGEVISERALVDGNAPPHHEDEEDDDDDYEYEYMEVEVDEYDDRGVAPAMQYIYDPEIRIHMLIVHGMLHLVGYDHIEDDDYELMVVREDEVLEELKRRVGNDFGLGRTRALPER